VKYKYIILFRAKLRESGLAFIFSSFEEKLGVPQPSSNHYQLPDFRELRPVGKNAVKAFESCFTIQDVY